MDDEFVDRVLSGEIEAFRYFLEKYKDMGFTVAVSIVKDDQYAEEVVQDSFLKAFNALNTFNKSAKFKTWFYRIVVNESFQRLRRLRRDVSVVGIESVDEITYEEVRIDRHQERWDLKNIMSLLLPNESLALNLFYLEEYTLKEICEITGWSLANTKVILHRARKNVRIVILAQEGDHAK